MKRRAFTAALGVLGTGVLAGCVSDDGSTTGGNDEASTDTPGDTTDDQENETDEPDSSTETEAGSGESSGDSADQGGGAQAEPVAVVESFFASFSTGETEQINQHLHPEGPRELDQEEATEAVEFEITVESLEVTERSEDRALVDVTFSEDTNNEFAALDKVELRPFEGSWRISEFVVEGQQTDAPNAGFEFDTGEDSVTVTHTAGDRIPADELYVRGEGLGETGNWAELGSDGEDEVAAGDSLTVPVTASEATVRVVWESADSSAVLASMGFASGSASDAQAPPEVADYLGDATGFEGVVDRTDRQKPTVMVGAGGDGLSFSPAAVRVSPGTTVVWEWTGQGGAHNVVHEDGEFESEIISEAESRFEHTFEESGTYLYYCAPHKAIGMKGAVIVE